MSGPYRPPNPVRLDEFDERLATEPALRAFLRHMRSQPDEHSAQLTDEEREHRQRVGFWVV